jgi:hypothetical protein
MAFTQIKSTQVAFLENHLRGTNRKMSADQARETYNVRNLRARISELRSAGLRIRKTKNTRGKTAYSISRRDVFGDQFRLFA